MSRDVEKQTDVGLELKTNLDDSDRTLDPSNVSQPSSYQSDLNLPSASAAPASQNIQTMSTQDWTGPNDPSNPHNWPMWKRVYHTIPPALIGFTMTFASSVYSPAVEDVAREFGVSRTAAILPLSLWVVGLALGPVIAAPISETFGRNVVYRASVPVSLLLTLGAGFSPNLATLLVLRLLSGTAGSPVLAVGGGTNVDLFPPETRAVATSSFLMAPFLGPSLGPFIGGFVTQYKGWRWTQWTILFFGALAYLSALPMEETYKKIILKRRAKKLGLPPPPQTIPSGLAAVKFVLTVTVARPLHMLIFEPIVTFMSLYTAFLFSVLFGFFAAYPYVFGRPPYNFSVSQVGLVFLAIGLGVVIAGFTAILIDRTIYKQHALATKAAGKPAAAPEHRLYSAMGGSVAVIVGLFWFAWTADKGVHWAVLVVSMVPFAWGNLSIFISTALYLVDVYGAMNGASALAANGIARYLLGAVFPLFTIQMYENLRIGWATSLLGFVSLAMLPIPWVLFKWGPKIRAHSAYEVTKF